MVRRTPLTGGGFAVVTRLDLADGRSVVPKVPPLGPPLMAYEAGRAAAEAIRMGTAAPPGLRAVTRELAGLRIDELDRRDRRTRVVFGMWLALAAVLLGASGYVLVVRHGAGLLLAYGIYCCVRAYRSSPWYLRRLRGRAEAAMAANAPA